MPIGEFIGARMFAGRGHELTVNFVRERRTSIE
jgi:hypothetical protein